MKTMIQLFKALSDRNRLRILAALSAHDELCACQIVELLQVTGATASRHLALLQQAELIDSRKESRWVYYRINHERDDLTEIWQWINAEFTKSNDISNDLDHLKEITKQEPEALCRAQRGKECCPL